MALNESDVARGERVKAIREGRGEDQPTFAGHLGKAVPARKYDGPLISKIESGSRRVTFEELEVIASLDPEGRGIAWVGWGELATAKKRQPSPQSEPGIRELDIRKAEKLQGRRPRIETPTSAPRAKRGKSGG